jgi:hypothetical protein
MLAEPVLPPLHAILVCEPTAKLIAGGCVILNVRLAVQPKLSVTMTVYVFADKPVAVEPVPPLGDQLNV